MGATKAVAELFLQRATNKDLDRFLSLVERTSFAFLLLRTVALPLLYTHQLALSSC
jgi:hypothetical protein